MMNGETKTKGKRRSGGGEKGRKPRKKKEEPNSRERGGENKRIEGGEEKLLRLQLPKDTRPTRRSVQPRPPQIAHLEIRIPTHGRRHVPAQLRIAAERNDLDVRRERGGEAAEVVVVDVEFEEGGVCAEGCGEGAAEGVGGEIEDGEGGRQRWGDYRR